MAGLTTAAASLSAHASKEVAIELESLLVKQLLTASGAFKGSGATGSGLTSELFAEALAKAVASSGQLGLGATLAQAMGGGGSPPAAVQATALAGGLAPGLAAALPLADPHAHLTSPFGQRTDPFDGAQRQHRGVDIAAKAGSPILAAEAGVVVAAGARGGYGQAVELQHGSGVTTLYAHAAQVLVHPGDRVSQGQAIATVGQTGRATGPHLHFELRQGGRPLDPTRALSVYGRRAEVFGSPLSERAGRE